MIDSRKSWVPSRYAALAVLLLPLVISVGFTSPRSGKPEAPVEPLRVLSTSPTGDVRHLRSIDVVFSEAIVALGDRRRAKKTVPLLIEPSIPGSFSWIGTRALTFVPESSPAPGTRITCRIPKGTRSVEGKTTQTDYLWEIIIDRPHLVRSIPAAEKAIAPDESIYMLFNAAPGPGAEDAVMIYGPDGPVRLTRVRPDSAAIEALSKNRKIEDRSAAQILALRPLNLLENGQSYRLVISREIPFTGTTVHPKEDETIEFRTFGSPRIRSAGATEKQIDLVLQGPVTPEMLADFLMIIPGVEDLSIEPRSGTSFSIKGGIRRGQTYEIRLRAGLTSLLGARLEAEQSVTVTTPHLEPELRITPSGGYLPRIPGLTVRVTATNLDSVQISGLWMKPDSIPSCFSAPLHKRFKHLLVPVAVWHEPRLGPDTLQVIDIPLARFGRRPSPDQALLIYVSGQRLYPKPNRPNHLEDAAFLQITDLGLSTVIDPNRGTAWVTRLSTGIPIPGAEVSITRPGRSTPFWSGTTDSEGLVWTPGFRDFKSGADRPLLARVRVGEDAAWIEIDRWGEFTRKGGRSSVEQRSRAHVETDRPLYHPGETVHLGPFRAPLRPRRNKSGDTGRRGILDPRRLDWQRDRPGPDRSRPPRTRIG